MALYTALWVRDHLVQYLPLPPIKGQSDHRFNSIFQSAYPHSDLLGSLSSYPYKFKLVRSSPEGLQALQEEMMEEGFGAFGLDVANATFEARSADEELLFLPSILQKGSVRQTKMILALLDSEQTESVANKMIHAFLDKEMFADALSLASYCPSSYFKILFLAVPKVNPLDLMKECLKIQPPEIRQRVLIDLCDLFMKNGNYDEAYQVADQVKDPRSFACFVVLIVDEITKKGGDLDKALSYTLKIDQQVAEDDFYSALIAIFCEHLEKGNGAFIFANRHLLKRFPERQVTLLDLCKFFCINDQIALALICHDELEDPAYIEEAAKILKTRIPKPCCPPPKPCCPPF